MPKSALDAVDDIVTAKNFADTVMDMKGNNPLLSLEMKKFSMKVIATVIDLGYDGDTRDDIILTRNDNIMWKRIATTWGIDYACLMGTSSTLRNTAMPSFEDHPQLHEYDLSPVWPDIMAAWHTAGGAADSETKDVIVASARDVGLWVRQESRSHADLFMAWILASPMIAAVVPENSRKALRIYSLARRGCEGYSAIGTRNRVAMSMSKVSPAELTLTANAVGDIVLSCLANLKTLMAVSKSGGDGSVAGLDSAFARSTSLVGGM